MQVQVRVRIDGRDAFIKRLGRWSDPVGGGKGTRHRCPDLDEKQLPECVNILQESDC